MASRQLFSAAVKAPNLHSFATNSHKNALSLGLLRGMGCVDGKTFLHPESTLVPICYRPLHQSQHQSELQTQSFGQKRSRLISAALLQDPACEAHSHGQKKASTENFSTSSKQLGKPWFPRLQNKNWEFFSIQSLLSTPFPYMAYGLGGLIPFMAAPMYMQAMGFYSPFIAQAQLVYGACILSFLGGVSWGEQLARAEKSSLESLSYSILLPLIAWPGVLLYPNISSFAVLISGIVYAGIRDTGNQRYPRWFRNLRFMLSVLVSGSLLTTAIFKFTKSTKEKSPKSVVAETHVSEKESSDK